MKRMEIRLTTENYARVQLAAHADNLPVASWCVHVIARAVQTHRTGKQWEKSTANEPPEDYSDAPRTFVDMTTLSHTLKPPVSKG